MVDRRVRFEISLEAAEKTGLTLSSRLLSVALRVRKGELDRDHVLAQVTVRKAAVARRAG